jgi:hypothetical protein
MQTERFELKDWSILKMWYGVSTAAIFHRAGLYWLVLLLWHTQAIQGLVSCAHMAPGLFNTGQLSQLLQIMPNSGFLSLAMFTLPFLFICTHSGPFNPWSWHKKVN